MSTATSSTATKIMVIRHAEKPAGQVQGVAPDGTADPESLTVQGWQRAGALAVLFDPTHGPLQNSGLAVPQFLFASKIEKHSDSQRPLQTITPLAAKLGLTVSTDHPKAKFAKTVSDARQCTGVVLICWEHQDIPAIANLLLGNDTTAPQQWPGTRFDVVWVFDWNAQAKAYQFSQAPQSLLAGDSPDPIPN